MTKEEFILSTIRPMAEYTFPYLTSVIGIKDPTLGEPTKAARAAPPTQLGLGSS